MCVLAESHVTALLHTVCGSDSPSSRDSDASDEPTFETTKSTSTDLSSEKKSADMDKVGATKSAQARKSVEFPDNDGKTPRKSKSSKSSKVLPVDDSTMEKEDKMEKIGAAPSVSSSTNSRATTSAFHKVMLVFLSTTISTIQRFFGVFCIGD